MSQNSSIMLSIIGMVLTIAVAMVPAMLRGRNHRLALLEIEMYERWADHCDEQTLIELATTINRRIYRINHPVSEYLSNNSLLVLSIVYLITSIVLFFIYPGTSLWLVMLFNAGFALVMHNLSKTNTAKLTVARVGRFFAIRKAKNDYELFEAKAQIMEERIEKTKIIQQMLAEHYGKDEENHREETAELADLIRQNDEIAQALEESRIEAKRHYYDLVESCDTSFENLHFERSVRKRARRNRRNRSQSE